MDAETRYRHALHELEAAEKDYQAHMALERAREAAVIRQRAQAEAALREREREIALYAEIERINRARALQEQTEERLTQRQRALRTGAAFDGTHCGKYGFMRGMYGDGERDGVLQTHGARTQRDNETLSIGDLLDVFAEDRREHQCASRPQRPISRTRSQPHHPPEPTTEREPREGDDAEVNLSDILEFFHNIAAQARGAGSGEQSTHLKESLPSQREATPVDEKGKGKVKAVPVPEPTLFGTLFREGMRGSHDQELRDIEHAIKLSLQDRDAGDAKKAHVSKSSQSSISASSSRVKVEDASSLGGGAAHRDTPSVSASIPEPVSPLTSIRAVRSQFSALESAFKFPPTLDFDHSELAVSSNNAPVRGYEYALNGLLEHLDAIESDGNEEVRDVRREVVREVERALEEVERKIQVRAPQAAVPEVTKQEAGEVESEDSSACATQAVVTGDAPGTEDAKPSAAVLVPVGSPADGEIDVAISAGYESASAVAGPSGVVVAERESAAGATAGDEEGSAALSSADTEVVRSSEDASDSIATIAPAPGAPGVPVPSSSNESASTSIAAAETFLTALSHDQFTFPPRPAFSQSRANGGVIHEDDAVVVDKCSEGGSVKSGDDEWTTEFDG